MLAAPVDLPSSLSSTASRGDELRKAGKIERAIEAYLSVAMSEELPPAAICLNLARCYERLGNTNEACKWALTVVDTSENFTSWQSAAALMQRCAKFDCSANSRSVRVALVGSYTTTQFAQLLQLAARRLGITLDIYESQYGQYRQDIIDPNSSMYAFSPDFVLLVVHEGELTLPEHNPSPEESIDAEVRRWTMLWEAVAKHSKARVVQYNFALPCEVPMGHLSIRFPGGRYAMTQALNSLLGKKAATTVLMVDCERLSALFGKQRWVDPRYWHLSKQAVSLDALPLLAKHTVAVIAADLGLSRKCLVLDLDNTLWGGVIGEDGLAGIKLAGGVDGEAFVSFQEYILQLKRKGVILAVCSKNNEADAKEPFEKHPEMRIKLDNIALFVANWRSKSENLKLIAKRLNIGLDTLVLVDDNPIERAEIRQLLPEVDVIPLPPDPTQYKRVLSQYLLFENSSLTSEDAKRTDQYRARAQIAEMEASANSIEDFYRSLQMQALIAPFDELHLPRIAQMIVKTNQFNLTTRRHGLPQLRAFMDDPNCVHFFLRLRDRFTDHGLVNLVIAFRKGNLLDIDTWLMSCRVIGRTVEAAALHYLYRQAKRLGCASIRGTYIPSTKNAMVKDIFGQFGFELVDENQGTSTWTYDIPVKSPLVNEYIKIVDAWENPNVPA